MTKGPHRRDGNQHCPTCNSEQKPDASRCTDCGAEFKMKAIGKLKQGKIKKVL